jgi:hypothetical protein
LYSSPSIIRIIKSYRLLVGKRPLGRPRCTWVDNIRMDLGEVGCGLDWCGSGQEWVESSCEFGTESLGSIKYWETIEWHNNCWPLE